MAPTMAFKLSPPLYHSLCTYLAVCGYHSAGMFCRYYHICEFVVVVVMLSDTAEARFVAEEEHVRKHILHFRVVTYSQETSYSNSINGPPIITKPFFISSDEWVFVLYFASWLGKTV